MAYHPQPEFVSAEQHRYVLTNFRIAHEKVEQQRVQLQEQEKQIGELRERIVNLEGREGNTIVGSIGLNQGGTSVDDWSIKNTASKLEKQINRWAAEVIRVPPIPLNSIRDTCLFAIAGNEMPEDTQGDASPMLVQSLLRHALAETISEAVVNCLIVTSSGEANVQLTRIHEHLFSRDPTVASVWRRQTFSAAVEACPPDLCTQFLTETAPELARLFIAENGLLVPPLIALMDSAVGFSPFVPELGSVLYPRQVELIKRCMKSENGMQDYVGATVFPGLVKVSNGPKGADGKSEMIQTVVRRAQVICACALAPRPTAPKPASEYSADSLN
ncbi:hypothetical protein PNOK_0782300 [Pyrrhoderma noxium]|uniref:Uncharacterized protein n=1 Tax=Pyrrhoderma noxium TaxID=2282107 RepID=A0A286U9F8_9AGAM|nr:hypothetical protein PNOK_0782300 [Pyrrhoderma noxium]